MFELSRQMTVYDEMRANLEADHFGKWIVMYDEQLAGTYESFEEAAEEAVCRFGRGPYLIRQVGSGPITLPASVLYRQVNADR